MTYQRNAGFQVRANLHFESIEEDAAYIAQEVVQRGRSAGWLVDVEEERPIAAEVEAILAKYNIGLVNPHAGVWGFKQGGTRYFAK